MAAWVISVVRARIRCRLGLPISDIIASHWDARLADRSATSAINAGSVWTLFSWSPQRTRRWSKRNALMEQSGVYCSGLRCSDVGNRERSGRGIDGRPCLDWHQVQHLSDLGSPVLRTEGSGHFLLFARTSTICRIRSFFCGSMFRSHPPHCEPCRRDRAAIDPAPGLGGGFLPTSGPPQLSVTVDEALPAPRPACQAVRAARANTGARAPHRPTTSAESRGDRDGIAPFACTARCARPAAGR
jgi:hypothetical protein